MKKLDKYDLGMVGLTRPPIPTQYIHAQPKLHKGISVSLCSQNYPIRTVKAWMNMGQILTPQKLFPCLRCFLGNYGVAIIHPDHVAVQWAKQMHIGEDR